MLAVSVSFLAVPGVTLYNLNNSNNEYQAVILKSSSQIASALSVETSIGSVVIGMFLVRHNRTKQDASPLEAVSEQSHLTCAPTRYLRRANISIRTVDCSVLNRWLLFSAYRGHCSCGRTSSPVSRTLILPIFMEFLLPDRMVTFSVALLGFCFVISNHYTRITVGVALALVVALTMLSLRIAWGSRSPWNEWIDGLLPSLVGPLQRVHGSVERLILFILGIIESFRNRLTLRGRGGAGNV
jgi:hypothetical protein